RGSSRVLKRAEGLGFERSTFPVDVAELEPEAAVKRNGYEIVPFSVDHAGAASIGYAIGEENRKGRFGPGRARELESLEGPLGGQIHRGKPVTLADGRVIDSSELVGPTRPGRLVVITGDTRPCDATVAYGRGADLIVHEATFGDEEAERAGET